MLLEYVNYARESDAYIESADFIGEHLSYDLSNLEFRFIKFIKCKFERCDFSNSDFLETEFLNCNFSGCSFNNGGWKRSRIISCNGDREILIKADLKKSTFLTVRFAMLILPVRFLMTVE